MNQQGQDFSETILLVTRTGMGSADQRLQARLFRSYLQLLGESDLPPAAICFYGEGVKMAVTGAPALDELKVLEEAGTYLLLCGTCLNHYQLTEQIEVGIVGGMTDIIEAQRRAEKVITI